MNRPSILTTQEILRLRNLLQGISNISYSFSKLNQKYPLDTLTEENAQEIIQSYKNLLQDVKKLMDNMPKGGSDNGHTAT